MNTGELILCQPTIPIQPVEVKISSAIKRGAEIVGSLIGGAAIGVAIYGINIVQDKVFRKTGWIDGPQEKFECFPFVLVGITNFALIEALRLVYDIGLHLLGPRGVYENIDLDKAGLRQHTWKLISKLEKVPEDADVIFSRIFHIRTAKEIQEKQILDRQLSVMEIFRRVFKEQFYETVPNAIPWESSVYIIEACGYSVIGGHMLFLYGLIFFTGFIDKVNQFDSKIRKEEQEEEIRIHKELENQVICDLLEAMYPAELAVLDAKQENREREAEVLEEEKILKDLEFAEEQEENLHIDIIPDTWLICNLEIYKD